MSKMRSGGIIKKNNNNQTKAMQSQVCVCSLTRALSLAPICIPRISKVTFVLHILHVKNVVKL